MAVATKHKQYKHSLILSAKWTNATGLLVLTGCAVTNAPAKAMAADRACLLSLSIFHFDVSFLTQGGKDLG